MGRISDYGFGSWHIWKGGISPKKYIQVLEQRMLPYRHCLFQGRPLIFQQDDFSARFMLDLLYWHSFIEESRCWNPLQAEMGQQVKQLLSSVPRCLQAVVKSRGDATQW